MYNKQIRILILWQIYENKKQKKKKLFDSWGEKFKRNFKKLF